MAVDISDHEFETIVKTALDAIPDQYATRIENLAFVIENDPTEEQRRRLKLHHGQTLFGLYEGLPLTKRGTSYSGVLPDKITIFKNPALSQAHDLEELEMNIRHTVWHEVAHYFGLDHGRIYELENNGG
jgi:predicted Zn-dependent protease with MMP-like domain